MGIRTRVKVCGITSVEDANMAVDQGVDGLGFIFHEKSPRNIAPDVAKTIIKQLPPFVSTVGVFVNRDQEEIEELVNYCGLNHLQLHGNETPKFCERLGKLLRPVRIIKAFRVADSLDQEELEGYASYVSAFLFDTYQKGVEGGTGHVFSWDVLKNIHIPRPVVLAGGLNPENVVEAVEKASPNVLDVNSGVEIEPGVKDHAALALLMTRLRGYETMVSSSNR